MNSTEVKEQQQTETESSNALIVNTSDLKKESLEIINTAIAEKDPAKMQDLTYLFNQNQQKKNMVRMDKLNELVDNYVDQAITRVKDKPDELSNQELLQGLKVAHDMLDKTQAQLTGQQQQQPLIQINNQTNEVNVNPSDQFNKESRNKINDAVMSILNSLNVKKEDSEIIDAETVEEQKDDR